MAKNILDTIMDELKGVEKDASTLTVGEGGESYDPFKPEPDVWQVSRQLFDSIHEDSTSDMGVFLRKAQSIALDAPEDYEGMTKFTDEILEAEGEASGQSIATLIEQTTTNLEGETWLEGTTSSGKNYRFILQSYEDEGEKVYEINGDRFDKDNYNATVKNITEKLDNISLAVSEKFEEGDALSGEEYLSAATQEPKITVGESYSSPRHMMDEVKVTPEAEERKKPWWQ